MADISSMSVAQLKKELASRGVDYSDCLEKSELVNRLKSCPAKPKPKHLTVGPMGDKHTATVIWMHGLGDTGAGWESAMEELAPQLPHVKFILPTAKTRPISMNAGMSMPGWYDIISLSPGAKEDAKGVTESADLIRAIIHDEEENGIEPKRIVLGGFSQGGAMSLYTSFTHPKRLAGVVAYSCYLPIRDEWTKNLKEENSGLPVLMAHGDSDPLIPMKVGQMSSELVKKAVNAALEFKSYKGMQHSACAEEIRDTLTFLNKVIPA